MQVLHKKNASYARNNSFISFLKMFIGEKRWILKCFFHFKRHGSPTVPKQECVVVAEEFPSPRSSRDSWLPQRCGVEHCRAENSCRIRTLSSSRIRTLLVSNSESKSHCDWRSVSQSILVSSPVWDSWPDIYWCLIVTVLFLWSAISDGRMGLYFVYAAGPCQSSLFRVRVLWDSWPYFTVSDLRLALELHKEHLVEGLISPAVMETLLQTVRCLDSASCFIAMDAF
jgi:hypothetical protein